MTLPRTLLDTREPFDAGLCGYDGPRDPLTSSEGLIVEHHIPARSSEPHSVSICGPDGCVELIGLAEIREVAASLTQVAASLTAAAKHNPKTEELL